MTVKYQRQMSYLMFLNLNKVVALVFNCVGCPVGHMLLYYEILAMTLGRGNSVMTDTTQLVIVPLTKKKQLTKYNVECRI